MGLDNFISDAISIWPNPAHNFMNVKFSEVSKEKIEYRITSLVGQLVQSGTIELGRTEYFIPFENLSTGHFMVHFIGAKGNYLYSTPLIIE
jgi:hypothetical protein